jgi:hypothetical protein
VDFGISTDRVCLEFEHVFYDADDVSCGTRSPSTTAATHM